VAPQYLDFTGLPQYKQLFIIFYLRHNINKKFINVNIKKKGKLSSVFYRFQGEV